jgi:hypothetical protein
MSGAIALLLLFAFMASTGTTLILPFLGRPENSEKRLLVSLYLSVCLFVWPHGTTAPTARIFMKVCV